MAVPAPVSVRAVGASLPDLRVASTDIAAAWGGRAKGTVRVCDFDQDPLTLAWDAATAALALAGVNPAEVDHLAWGVARPPFAEGPSHALLAASLEVPPDSEGALFAGSPTAGLEALFSAWDAIAAHAARVALVVASEATIPGPGTSLETRTGAGAVAFVLSGAGGSARLVARASRSRPTIDRYRGDREPASRDLYDGRLFREEVFLPETSALATALAADVESWSLPDPDGRLGAALSKRLGGELASAELFARAGETGAAAPLLGLLPALTKAGRSGAIAHGGGRTLGVAVEADAAVPGADTLAGLLDDGRDVPYTTALRSRGLLEPTGESVPMGVPPGSAQFVRGGRELLSLQGARCVDCGAIATPPDTHPSCLSCGGGKLEVVPLARAGGVHTFFVNFAMPPPFIAPLPIAILDLDDGSRLMLQVTGGAEDLQIGERVELVLRRHLVERGAPVYGFKARRSASRTPEARRARRPRGVRT